MSNEMIKYSGHSISFLYPKTWPQKSIPPGVTSSSGGLVLAICQEERRDVPGPTITLVKDDLAGMTLEDLVAQQMPDATKEKLTVGKHAAILAREEASTPVGSRKYLKLVVLKDNSAVYSLSCSVDMSEYPAHQEIFKEIFNSFTMED